MEAKKGERIAGSLVLNNQYAVTIDAKDNIFMKCPKCEKRKKISQFGFRQMGASVIRNQSWCTECRNV